MTAGESFNAAAQDLDGPLLQEAAAETPNLLKMKQLINAGANPNVRNAQQHTVLLVAIGKGNADAAGLLIDNGADMYAKVGDMRSSAMAHAIAHYNLDCVRVLLDRGFDPNREPCHGDMMPLMFAAWLKQLAIAEELARRGADIQAKNPKNNMTAMDYAENNNKPHIAERLRSIDAEMKEQARREAQAEKERAEQLRRDAAQREFNAVCDAGLPVERQVKTLKRISFKQRMAQ